MRKLNKRSRLMENTIEAYSGVGCPCNIGCSCPSCYCNTQALGNSVAASSNSTTLSGNQYSAQHTPA